MSAEAFENAEAEASREDTKGKESQISALPDTIRDYIRALRRENKEYREQAKLLREELEKIKPLAEKAAEIEQKYADLVERQKEKLLARLPEEKREKYKGWSIEQIEALIEDFLSNQEKKQSPGAMQGRPLPQKEFSEMSQEELVELRIHYPEQYYKLLNDFISKKYNTGG